MIMTMAAVVESTICQHCGAAPCSGYTDHSQECPNYDKLAHIFHLGTKAGALTEREACAVACDEEAKNWKAFDSIALRCAEIIRARK